MAISEAMTSVVQPLSPHGLLLCALVVALLPILYYVLILAYNVYFHPLSKYPGPRIAASTPLWIALSYVRGNTPDVLLRLHDRYGPVVRTSPNELSFIEPLQWKEIYGHKPPGHPEFSKDEKYHSGLKGGPTILNADRHYHGHIRKLLAHGFSDKSLREQEAVIQEYVNVLMQRLHEVSQGGSMPVDIASWYNFMTFDLIGFLTFGESFHCLTSSRIHKWIEIFFSLAKNMAFSQAIARFPRVVQTPLKMWAIPMSIKSDLKTLNQLNEEKIKYRLETESTIPDFMDKLIDSYKSGKMTFEQLIGNAGVLIGAGSETTATLLAGLTYLLLKNPRVLQRLTKEIRGTFQQADEITITRVSQCKYLFACIEEGLRFYPPSPQPHHRIVPPGGAVVNGEYLPERVAVAIPICTYIDPRRWCSILDWTKKAHAACRSQRNFSQPDKFIPERWMGEDPQFENDRRDASQPFHFGPRNCIGRNLAYVEMKIIIARLVWHFDIENATEGDWLDQKVYIVWEKSPLWVKLRPVPRG